NPYFLISAIGFILYLPSLFFNFTYADDNVLILDNQVFFKSISNIPTSFKEALLFAVPSLAAYYRPVLLISFILDAQIGGTAPFVYHLSNLIFHLTASILVYLFLCRIGYNKDLSFIFALVFTVHPLLTQAVAWIPGRNDLLLAIFVLGSFIFLIDFCKDNKGYQAFLHLLFFALALFTKESAIVLILIFIMYFILIKPSKVTIKNLFIPMAWLSIFILWFLVRKTALNNSTHLLMLDVFKSIIVNFPALVIYVGKLFFPLNLSAFPDMHNSTKIYGFLVIAVFVIALFFSKEKRYNFIIFGLSWFLLFLLPTFLPLSAFKDIQFFEHRIYVPMIGFIILILEIDFIKKLDIRKRINALIITLILLILSVTTLSYSETFRNDLNFWENAVKFHPNSPIAHNSLGGAHQAHGLLLEAETEYKKSLELDPKQKMVHSNLGVIYMDKNMLREAEEEYKKEIALNPLFDKVYFNLARLYYKQGRLKEAEESRKKLLEINPNFFK
ncbi:MAG: tetratricopeptide repeat protein, partial [bacterium]|nr:tetratricopeptide repeat protein [bacterium]